MDDGSWRTPGCDRTGPGGGPSLANRHEARRGEKGRRAEAWHGPPGFGTSPSRSGKRAAERKRTNSRNENETSGRLRSLARPDAKEVDAAGQPVQAAQGHSLRARLEPHVLQPPHDAPVDG